MEPQKEQQHLPQTIRQVWCWRQLIRTIVLLLIALGIGRLHFLLPRAATQWLTGIAWGVAALSLIVFGSDLIFNRYRWRYWAYQVTTQQMTLQSGYFFRKEVLIPIRKIQNVTLTQGPLLRRYQLQALQIVTAAGVHELAGLPVNVAQQVKNQIMALAREARDEF